VLNADCTSNACDAVSLTCVANQCDDRHKDDLESDVDCGGPICPRCAIDQTCLADTDCKSDACDGLFFRCVATQCADHRQDGMESDVDCGGPVCGVCASGKKCNNDFDCYGSCDPTLHVCT
jgi:hypothetical protein